MKNKIYKLLSIVLAVMIMFSCCSVAFTAFAEEDIVATYYISATGSDETGTGEEATPFLTVGKAITQATTDGHNVAGNTVAIHVTNEAADTSVNMIGSLSAANCDLIIYADAAQTVLYNPSGSIAFSGTGSLTFKNIYLYAKQYSSVSFGNKNVSFDSGSKLAPGGGGGYVSLGLFNTNSSTTTPLYFTMEGQSSPIYLCDPQSTRTFKNVLYITYDSANSHTFYVGNPRSDLDCVTTYTKPVNFNIKNATAVTFGTALNSTRFTDDGLIQVINSSGVALTGLDTIVTAKVNTTTSFEADETPVTKWIINNTTTEYKDALSFTDTVGVYDVAEGYTAIATKADDASVVVASAAPEDSQDVVLDLSSYGAGEYNVTIEKIPETFTYYIASAADGGLSTNDGLYAATPLLTVNEVITAANANEDITAVDTIEVKIVGTQGTADWGNDIAFNAAKLVISSNDTANKSKLNGPNTVSSTVLGGLVEVDNVSYYGFAASGNPNRLVLNGRNWKFGSGVTVGSGQFYTVFQLLTINDNHTIEFNNAVTNTINLTHWNNNGVNFKKDLTYIINNANATPSFNFSTAYDSASATKVGGNLNFVIYDASKVTFGAKGTKTNSYYNISGAIQVINPSDITLDLSNLKVIGNGDTEPAGGIYHIIDDTGITHGVEFVPELDAGQYKLNIDRDMYNVYVTPEGGEKTLVDGEYLTVDEAGTYTVTKEKKSNLSVTYFVSAAGSDENNGKTVDAPFLTLKKAVDTAIAKGYATSDIVTVKTVGSASISTGLATRERLSDYAFKLVVTANDTSVKGTLSGVLQIGGETEFTYVTAAGQFAFGGYSATFGEGAAIQSSSASYVAQNTNAYRVNTTAPTNIKIAKYANAAFNFQSAYYSGATYNYPITVEIDQFSPYYNDVVYGGFFFSDGNNTGTYNAAVNVKIDAATSNVIPFKSNVTKATYGENFAFQFINASDKPLGKTGDTLKRSDATTGTLTSALDSMPEGSVYVLTNNTDNKDLITFTSTVGVYQVNGIDEEFYFVRATSVADSSVYYDSQNGLLTVEPGEYTITKEKYSNLTATYYVGSTGTAEGDGSESKPFETVAQAVEAAVEKGYAAGDTITVKVLDDTYFSDSTTSQGCTLTTHAFKLNIDSDLETNPVLMITKIDLESVNSCNLSLGGDTYFGSVTVSGFDTYGAILYGGHNVEFSSKAKCSPYAGSTIVGGTYDVTYDIPGQTLLYNHPVTTKYFNIGCKSNGVSVYSDDLNIVINNASASPRFAIRQDYNNGVTFNENANLNVKVLNGSVSFYEWAANTTTKAINSAVQLYYNKSGATADSNTKTYFGETLVPAKGVYYIYNNTGVDNIIDFVPNTAGTYKVNLDTARYNLFINGEAATITDGIITVPAAGEYELTVTVNSINAEYYVDSSVAETGDGTVDAPFATVAEAIAAGNAEELIAGDTVTVKVVGETAATWGTAEAYTFLLKVVSNDTENISTVNATTVMTGAVHFDDIFVRGSKSTDNPYRVSAGGYNVTFGSGVKTDDWFSLQASKQGVTNANPQTFVLNNAFIGGLLLGNNTQGYITFKSNVDVLVNNASAAPAVTFFGHYGGDVTFNSNLNFNLKNAASISFGDITKTVDPESSAYANGIRSGVVSVGGAAQLLMPGSTTISDESLANFKGLSSTYYIVRNNTGEELEFTATAGVYTVSGSDAVYVYKDGVKVGESANGTLDLASLGAGEYVLVKVREPQTFEYTNSDGTTIADMITKAINNGAIEGDTLRITLTGTDAIEYGTPVEHLFDVEIISAESTPVSFVSNAILAGDTKFDGVIVSYPSGENTLWLGGHNVEMTAATTISGGYYIGLGAHNNNIAIDTQTVKFDCAVPMYLILAGDYANITRTGALNVSLGHATTNPIISFGFHGTNTYADVNINLGTTTETSFKYIGDGTHVFTGDLKVIGENQLKDTTYLDSLSANVYTVYNKTGVAGVLGFGEGAGEFTVAGEDVVRAISANAYADSQDGVLTLTTKGHYYIGIPHIYDGEESTYADYIDYRTALNGNDALNNFAAKVKAGEDVNVVYYGGSVTAGSGASVADKTSWRGITSSWLQINAPNVNVTNVNSAIGGTGSHFGFYRLDEAVLANDPDLLFIEYSINDFYDNQDLWNIGENEAAMQLESIVRKVRTEAPECDIVIVLTTERSLINSLKESDTLHAQARGHYKIAEKYGIPTLRVGHALADTLSANWADNDYAEWYEYVTDIVHPTDKGYQIYAGVVKEFLANSLLGDNNDGALIKNHTVPTNIVSEEIWAGDPVFIQANAELSAESVALGGSEFAVADGRSYPYHTTTFRMSDPDAVLKFKFTGTELSILDDQYSNHYNGVNVKIDGGEEKYVEFRNYKPTVLASGLDNVEHTAEVRIADVNAGGGHWVYGFFVRNEADNILKTAEEATYYVETGATDGDGSLLKPFANVMEAVAAANANGYIAGDTVNAMLIGTEAIEWGTGINYDFLLVVDSADNLTVNNANDMTGDVKFDNVTVANVIYADGYNVEITENTSYNKEIRGQRQEKQVNETQTIKVGNAYTGGLYPGWANYGAVTWNEDANYIFTNANAYPTLKFATAYGGTNTFKKNFNVILKDASGVAIGAITGTASQNGSTYKSVVNGAINFLIPADATISETSIANLYNLTSNVYYVENALGNAGTIDYVTGSTGQFVITADTSKYTLYLTDEEGNSTEIQGGNLQLPAAGKYTVSATRKAATVTYYAQAGGTGDGSSAESPLGSVDAVIAKAIADDNNYSSITVKLVVLGTEALPWDLEAANRLTAHNFTLVIDSETEGAQVGNGSTIHMGGNTEIDNIFLVINGTSGSYPSLGANGYDLTIGSGVTFGGSYWSVAGGLHSGSMTLTDDQYITINAPVKNINVSNTMSASNWNKNAYIVYNAASGSPSFNFGSQWGASTYNANVIIDIKAASGATFGTTAHEGGSNFGENAKIQVIDRVGLGLSTATAGLANIDSTKVWVIEDATGELGTVTATGTVGTFAVETIDPELYVIKAIAATGGTSFTAENGILTIPAAGTYTIKVVRTTVSDTIYVSANGTSNASGDIDDPFLTVADAIAAAVEFGFGAEDTITIKLMGNSVDTGAIPAYEFDLIVASADANTKTTLNVTTNTLTNNEGGDVRFSNVTIAKSNQYSYVVLNDSNATFDSDVSFSFGYDTFLAIGTDNDGGLEKIVENGRDIIFNSTTPIVSLSNNRWANRIYAGDVNVVINNANASTKLYFNANYGGASNGNTIFNEKLNINIKDASAVSFNYGAGVIVNGGLQIINSSANEISIDDAAIAAITGDKWIINNKLSSENIAFTEKAGEFTVNFDTENYYLLITYADGTEFKSSSTSLVLEAGEYTIEKVKIPKEASYELNAEGKENTYASVEEAILAANAAGFAEGDIVTFNLSGTAAIPWGQTLEGPTRLTDYEYNLIIQTIEGQDTKATINELNASNRSVTVRLSGPTEFKNVTINVNGDSGGYPTFGMGSNDVRFNSDVSFVGGSWGFVTGQYNHGFTTNEDMDLYIANGLTGIKIGNSYTGNTYGADVNITYNNANASPTFTFGTNSTEKTTFKKNVNFNLMAAKGVSFATTGHAFAVGSAIQIINSTNVTVDSTTAVLADLVDTEGNAVPKYIITNKTGNANAISFTETAGVYELDLGELKYKGYYAVITNNATGEVTLAKGDSVTLAAGEYTVTTARDPLDKEYTITSGTLADAVQTAIDEGYGYGDNITFKLGTLEEINVGTLPKYNFNLVIESEADTRLVMNESRSIANNEGAHTHFKNVEIYNEAKWSTINLNGSSATFDKDVVITTGGYGTLSFGTSADEGKQVVGDQKVVLDCVAPTYISLSSWNYANRTYEGDVTLVLNNSNTNTTVWFNAYYGGKANGTTQYLGNININVKDAGSVKFDYLEGIASGGTTFVQLLVDDNTTIDEEQVIEINEALSYGDIFYIIDKSFERGILEFTDEVGVYEVTGEYPATITNTKKYDYGNWEFVDCEPVTYDEVDNKFTLTCDLEEGIIDSGIWEVRTTEYFEDFNDKTLEELSEDWKFSSDSDAVEVETQLVDGTVKLVSQHNLREIPALNKNINIKSKDQYISVDMKGDSFGYYNGLEILARLGGAAVMESYQFHISGGFIRLQKLDGVTKSGGYYQATNDGFEMDGLWGRKPGTISAIKDGGANNTFTFNTDHTYRIGFSVVTDTDKSGNEIAYVRGIVLNLTTNEVMFDDTFKDTAPYQGEEFAILSPAGGSNVYIDNLYFSSEKFREGDAGMVAGDINGDGVYDVRDLVYTDENAANADSALIYKTDKNYNGTIDAADFTAIRLDILNDVEIGAEFDLSGASDAAADALREQILGSTSTLNGKVYTATTNGQVVLTHTITGDIWYVSSKADGTGDGTSAATPWTLEQLQSNTVLDNNYATTTYKDCKVQEGDAVLFERGSEFRTNNLLMDKSTSGLTTDAYSYMFMSEGTFYGAYGEGAKPKFIDSYMNYADATWTEVAGQENIYVIDAPEIIIDKEGSERTVNGKYATENSATNIVFDGGAKVGQRKHFPVSCTNDKIYSIYKDGQFTYDETTGKLYLYSANGNPGEIYESIEISRGIQAIQVNSHEGNVKVDNLAFHGFARGTIGSSYGTDSMWVTNCDIGYSGGITMGNVRGGNAVGGWCGGSDYKINHNWIYQTWDTAISPQGNQGSSYNGFEVIGNLLEYNNADIEIFDRGTAANVTREATWEDCVWTDNIMRFTTLGWGSREADKIRGIQGVIRGGFAGSSSVEVNWSNNIIDTPGMEIIRLNNAMDITVEGEGDSAVTTVNSIFRFGTGTSAMDNNTYYYNPYVRNTSLAVREYMTAVPADYEAEHGEKEGTARHAKTAADYYDAMRAFDLGNNSKFFWGGVQVTQGN